MHSAMTLSLIEIFVIAYIIKIINIAICCMLVHPAQDYLHYFTYGSNLFKKKIQLKSPTAIFVGPGRVDAHKLEFVEINDEWEGAVATIAPEDKENAWGGVWTGLEAERLNTMKKKTIDAQDYLPKDVNIQRFDGKKKKYLHFVGPRLNKSLPSLPDYRQPLILKKCILDGDRVCRIPEDYADRFKILPTKIDTKSLKSYYTNKTFVH